MSLQYVIDAYNVIHHRSFSKLSNKKNHDLRLALPILIRNKKLAGSPNNKVIIIFDGYASAEDSMALREANPGMKIIFSEDESADERIRKIAEDSSGNKNIVIVSDDNEIKLFSKLFKVGYLSVKEFLKDEDLKSSRAGDDNREPGLNYSQVNDINQELKKLWLK